MTKTHTEGEWEAMGDLDQTLRGTNPPTPELGVSSTRKQSSQFVVLCYSSSKKLTPHRCLNLVATLWRAFHSKSKEPWLWGRGSLHVMSPSCFLKEFLLKEKWDRECIFRMRNLEKWHEWTNLQGRKRDAEVENRRAEAGEGGMNWANIWHIYDIWIYTVQCIKKTASGKLLYGTGRELSSALCDDLGGWGGWGGVEGCSRGREYMYTRSWCISLYSEANTRLCKAITLQLFK